MLRIGHNCCVCVCGLLGCRGRKIWLDGLWYGDAWTYWEWYVWICAWSSERCAYNSRYRHWQRPVFACSHNRSTISEHSCTKCYCYCTKRNHYCTASDLSVCTYRRWNFSSVTIGAVVKDIISWWYVWSVLAQWVKRPLFCFGNPVYRAVSSTAHT